MLNKINELLDKRVKSPTPPLQADPFLATKIAQIAHDKESAVTFSSRMQLSFITLIGCVAILTGIYIGSNLLTETQDYNDFMSEYTGALYQSDFTDNLNAVDDNGEMSDEK